MHTCICTHQNIHCSQRPAHVCTYPTNTLCHCATVSQEHHMCQGQNCMQPLHPGSPPEHQTCNTETRDQHKQYIGQSIRFTRRSHHQQLLHHSACHRGCGLCCTLPCSTTCPCCCWLPLPAREPYQHPQQRGPHHPMQQQLHDCQQPEPHEHL